MTGAPSRRLTRRRLLGGLAAAGAAGAGAAAVPPPRALAEGFKGLGEALSYRAHRLLAPDALAREYAPDQISPVFQTNGSTSGTRPDWLGAAQTGFADWALTVDGAVRVPRAFPLAQLRAMPARTQITRHDCVEGWSAIGQWTGVPLSAVLEAAGLLAEARYIVFWCADVIGGLRYYESIDLIDAFHPQTILAYGMNGAALPIAHGAPLRLRVERQLGYKHAKFVTRIEAVADLAAVGFGNGGFWEDLAGYEWYAGV